MFVGCSICRLRVIVYLFDDIRLLNCVLLLDCWAVWLRLVVWFVLHDCLIVWFYIAVQVCGVKWLLNCLAVFD